VLIDGGPSGKRIMESLSPKMPYLDGTIEVVIATHPDKDHIAGLVEVARNYKILKVLEGTGESDTKISQAWDEIVEEKKIESSVVRAGDRIDFNGVSLKVLNPPADSASSSNRDINDQSVVVRLDYGEHSFLFTGDIGCSVEERLMDSGADLDADVLKVSHHGSKHGSCENFLKQVTPSHAVIQVGEKNSYAHPDPSVLERLEKSGAQIFRTDERSTVTFKCKFDKEQCQIATAK